MYRANDRHPEDERILVIQDVEEFELFKERQKLGFNGIIHDLGVTSEQIAQSHDYINHRFDKGNGQGFCEVYCYFQKGAHKATTIRGIIGPEDKTTPIKQHFDKNSIGGGVTKNCSNAKWALF